jgi:hypothetical protein
MRDLDDFLLSSDGPFDFNGEPIDVVEAQNILEKGSDVYGFCSREINMNQEIGAGYDSVSKEMLEIITDYQNFN